MSATATIIAVQMVVENLERSLAVYRTIASLMDTDNGSSVTSDIAAGITIDGVRIDFTVNESGQLPIGISAIEISVTDLPERLIALQDLHINPAHIKQHYHINASHAHGINVTLSELSHEQILSQVSARFDHLALRVADLAAAADVWAAITGTAAIPMGIHPVSNGTFEASRIALGARMIELISPVPGVPSQIADRLESHGEGVATLALPVSNLQEVLDKLNRSGVRVLDRPPHWFVHPNDAGGVLVQLTPRVEH